MLHFRSLNSHELSMNSLYTLGNAMKPLNNLRIQAGLAIATAVVMCMGFMATNANAAATAQTSKVIRLGYLNNLTHAPALVARDKGFFEKYLDAHGTIIQYVTFNAGTDIITALKGRAIDLAFVGPNPTVNGYVTTQGTLLRVISGTTSGGAEFVVAPNITNASQLKGTKIASPQLGNTQDVALRTWLKSQKLKTTITGKGDVAIIPTSNSAVLGLFNSKQLQGAWLPEPWSSQLVLKGGAHVLVNEKTLWTNGLFITTNLIAGTEFLGKYPGTVKDILNAELDTISYLKLKESDALASVQHQLLLTTGATLATDVLKRAWGNLSFTVDPVISSLRRGAINAVSVGLLPALNTSSLKGIYDLRLLNGLLKARKLKTISTGGLGV